MMFRVRVRVTPRPGLLDPQGTAVEHALHALGFAGASDVRVGRAIDFMMEAVDAATAIADASRMCERLLANPVTEDFTVAVES
ncbi:MAG TPA: phosphoribosylformylglycinamidine synthase subunit PurS [Gemmatimonadales bacterium]|nr:phosphoribosylformylglycinamidine synthase subunit PurS [Gemmatimonadales bacterium]